MNENVNEIYGLGGLPDFLNPVIEDVAKLMSKNNGIQIIYGISGPDSFGITRDGKEYGITGAMEPCISCGKNEHSVVSLYLLDLSWKKIAESIK